MSSSGTSLPLQQKIYLLSGNWFGAVSAYPNVNGGNLEVVSFTFGGNQHWEGGRSPFHILVLASPPWHDQAQRIIALQEKSDGNRAPGLLH